MVALVGAPSISPMDSSNNTLEDTTKQSFILMAAKPPHNRPTKNDDQDGEMRRGDGAEGSTPLAFVGGMSRDPQVYLAIYIAMAHAGLALTLALLYGLGRLLEAYWRPIQWALLCSMPLRELHTALVSFWSHPLRLGLLETILAIPLALVRSAATSIVDSYAALLHLFHRRSSRPRSPSRPKKSARIGFAKLMQWLVSFGAFVLLHERIGTVRSIPVFAITAFVAYAVNPRTHTVATTLAAISSARSKGRKKGNAGANAAAACSPFYSRLSRYMTSVILVRLNTIVAVSLITMMIIGAVSGFLFFSYKIANEGKDAVISLKTHMEEHNYSEKIGLQRWLDNHDVPEMIESCSTKFYESVSEYVDSVALQYNATEIVDGFRHYLIRPLESRFSNASSSMVYEQVPHHPGKLRNFMLSFWNLEWKVIYAESYDLFTEFLSAIDTDDLVEKVKGFALQSIDVSKRVFASSTMVVSGSANLVFKIALSIISGAAGLLNFVSQLMVFFWLLYYLITSESGGVMDYVIEMLPISKTTRVRCAHVLGHAVSSVLLATAKVALFQGSFTYLLFRFYRIHFLYVSTFLAWMSAILPITPFWVSSIPAAVQLAVETRYIEAVVLTALHLFFLDYGTIAIQDEIPGQSAYLTGLSILGGMALFPSVLEGAIMGPLLMTIMIALKNLYTEFVLLSSKERRL